MKERPILMTGPLVVRTLDDVNPKTRRKLYPRDGESPTSPSHLARRLMNAIEGNANGCWEWQRTRNNHGYGTLTVSRRTVLAHRLAFELSGRALRRGQQVLHKCDNPPCINPSHLFAGNRSDNMRDCVAKGRHGGSPTPKRGEQNPASKLTRLQAESIRRRAVGGERHRVLAAEYGISPSQISNIKQGRQWA